MYAARLSATEWHRLVRFIEERLNTGSPQEGTLPQYDLVPRAAVLTGRLHAPTPPQQRRAGALTWK